MLTVLRNRVYLGEIFFRGTCYPAPHQPLIGRNVFDQVQRLLVERGVDHAGHAADASDTTWPG